MNKETKSLNSAELVRARLVLRRVGYLTIYKESCAFRNSPTRANGSPSFMTKSRMLSFMFLLFSEGRHLGVCSDRFYKKTQRFSNYFRLFSIWKHNFDSICFKYTEEAAIFILGNDSYWGGASPLIFPSLSPHVVTAKRTCSLSSPWHNPCISCLSVLPCHSTASSCHWSRTEKTLCLLPFCGRPWC